MWHGDDQTDVHLFREDEDRPTRWYAYPVVIAPHGAISTDTGRLLASGDVPEGERRPLSAALVRPPARNRTPTGGGTQNYNRISQPEPGVGLPKDIATGRTASPVTPSDLPKGTIQAPPAGFDAIIRAQRIRRITQQEE